MPARLGTEWAVRPWKFLLHFHGTSRPTSTPIVISRHQQMLSCGTRPLRREATLVPRLVCMNGDLKRPRPAVALEHIEPPVRVEAKLAVEVTQAFGGKARGNFPGLCARTCFFAYVILVTNRVTVIGVEIV